MSLCTSSHTCTYRSTTYTYGRPADPLPGTVFQNTVPARYAVCSYVHSLQIGYSTISQRNIMRARAHTCCMAWHGIYSIALRAQLSERLRRRSKRQPQWN